MKSNRSTRRLAAISAAAVLAAGMQFPAVLPSVMPVALTAQALEDAPYTIVETDTLQYIKYEDHAAVTGCKPDVTAVEIPESIEGVPVTCIDMYAFQLSSLTSVTIPETVTTIGHGAFGNFKGLTSVKLPDSIESVGIKAFQDCTSLETVEFPDHVVAFNSLVFDNTPWLKAQREKGPLVIVNDMLLDAYGAEGDVVIPSTVKYVASSAFAQNTAVTSVVFPASVTSINDDVFFMCSNLTSVEMKGCDYIGIMAFAYCDKLTDVKISGKLTKIDMYAFTDIAASGTVTFYGSEDTWKKVEILDTGDYLKNAKFIFDEIHQKPEPSGTLPGDVNGDGEVTVLDAIALQKWILAIPGGGLKVPEAGDMNEDGVVDIFDLCLLRRALLK